MAGTGMPSSPYLRDYVTSGVAGVPTELFPNGFYRFSRRSFTTQDVFILSVVMVRRDEDFTVVRGFESVQAMSVQDLPTATSAREFRGMVMRQENGIVILVSRKNAMTSSFNYLSPVPSFDNNFWVGYVTRTIPETVGGLRATRMVYEYLGPNVADALPVARKSGFHTADELPPFHRRLLQPDVPFG
ncbi:DNA-binding protein [Sulfitobacter noctilucae]|nr:DNA-binding protein [Sulfitobacter noctilucae]